MCMNVNAHSCLRTNLEVSYNLIFKNKIIWEEPMKNTHTFKTQETSVV